MDRILDVNNKVSRISKSEREQICAEVVERDESRCILCSAPYDHIAHIVPRSRSVKFDARLWTEKNLGCLCLQCHGDGENHDTRIAMLQTLSDRFSYDYYEDIYAEFLGFLED